MGLRDSLAMQLREAYFSIRRSAQARVAASGATVDQVVVLTLISEQQGLTQRDIVQRSCSDPSTIRAMLVLLEEQLRTYHWAIKEANDVHGKRRITQTGKVGNKQDDLVICFMMLVYWAKRISVDPRWQNGLRPFRSVSAQVYPSLLL